MEKRKEVEPVVTLPQDNSVDKKAKWTDPK